MPDNARSFDTIAREVFAPIYPIIADQILKHTGISSGRCMDLGCGPGYLGLSVAKQSDMDVTFFDQSQHMLAIARENITARGLDERSRILLGNVTRIPIQEQSVDLAVSRGSVFFWERPSLAFTEINRILAPGGKAVIGGGFGTAELRERIAQEMETQDLHPGQWRTKVANNLSRDTALKYERVFIEAQITNYEIELNEEIGFWITIYK